MSRDADPAPAASPVPRVVSQTTPCLRCGYDLVGVSFSAVCPECGLAAMRTLLGDPLHFSEASYLKSLARGMTMIRVGLLAMLVLGVVPLIIAIAFFATRSHRVPGPTILIGLVPPAMGIFLSHIAVAAGHFLIAAPEIGLRTLTRWEISRRAIRILSSLLTLAFIALTAAGISLLVLDGFTSMARDLDRFIYSWIITLAACLALFWWVLPATAIGHVLHLARRARDEDTARFTHHERLHLIAAVLITLPIGPLLLALEYVSLMGRLRARVREALQTEV